MTGEKRKTGGSNDYYSAEVSKTLDGRPGYVVQCLEVIETLGMTFAEGEAFKAIWRSCAARTLGKHKADNNALYDAEKVEFYGKRMVVAAGDRGQAFAAGVLLKRGEIPLPTMPVPSEAQATHRQPGGAKMKRCGFSGRWLQWGNQQWFFASSDENYEPTDLIKL